ncbi:mCG146324, partial [Mus musculus]
IVIWVLEKYCNIKFYLSLCSIYTPRLTSESYELLCRIHTLDLVQASKCSTSRHARSFLLPLHGATPTHTAEDGICSCMSTLLHPQLVQPAQEMFWASSLPTHLSQKDPHVLNCSFFHHLMNF